jgi:hypothetical protein
MARNEHVMKMFTHCLGTWTKICLITVAALYSFCAFAQFDETLIQPKNPMVWKKWNIEPSKPMPEPTTVTIDKPAGLAVSFWIKYQAFADSCDSSDIFSRLAGGTNGWHARQFVEIYEADPVSAHFSARVNVDKFARSECDWRPIELQFFIAESKDIPFHKMYPVDALPILSDGTPTLRSSQTCMSIVPRVNSTVPQKPHLFCHWSYGELVPRAFRSSGADVYMKFEYGEVRIGSSGSR